MSYKSKLDRFNSTEKYKQEMEFMYNIMNPEHSDFILDYGCGTGYMVTELNELPWEGSYYGYDIGFKYLKYKKEDVFASEFDRKFDHIYFMHSIAHISDLEDVLSNIKDMLTDHGKVHVMTPNKVWLDGISQDFYEADPTVVKHFTPLTLEGLFLKCNYAISNQGQYGTIMYNQHERLFLTATRYE